MAATESAATGRVRRHTRRLRPILTPEGVELTVELAGRGERLGAFLIDMFILTICVVVLMALVAMALFAGLSGRAWILAFGLILFFLLRTFYFAIFELHWQGATPGKRAIGLRVIDRAGGPLRPSAIVARNLMREVEVFLPLSLMLAPQQTGDAYYEQLLMLIWVAAFVGLPLLNKDSLRVGDIVGGTMVIAVPKAVLLPDLTRDIRSSAATVSAATGRRDSPGPYVFTPKQLDVYGVFELQTLEEVLRRNQAGSNRTWEDIADRIRSKIDWHAPEGHKVDARLFLQAFYTAQRAQLERRMLFGVRRADKHDRR